MEIFFTPFATTMAAMVDMGESEFRYSETFLYADWNPKKQVDCHWWMFVGTFLLYFGLCGR
ncbi:hypothetical protein HanPI659440_Chr08g0294391 [Helianthus annuus]|nr:hypothetical protein HanPI659440_Chr08g0294391 [Helianthus annuus]